MKRICLDARMMEMGGVGTFVTNMIPPLVARNDIELTLLVHARSTSTFSGIQTIATEVPVHSFRGQRALAQAIPACDLFWSPHFNVPLLPIRAKKRMATVHDLYPLARPNDLPFARRQYAKLFYNAAFFLSHTVTAASEFTKQQIYKLGFFMPKKLKVIPSGIDLELFSLAIETAIREEIKKRYQLPEKFFLCVSEARPHKNLNRLFSAYEHIEKTTACDLVIVGKHDGSINKEAAVFRHLKRRPHLKKRIHFLGTVMHEDLPTLYSLATLMCFPSLYEGFGYPPIEAMACGCPVIVSKSASLPEVCGEGAFYVDPFNIEAMSSALFRVSKEAPLRQTLIMQGKKQAQTHSIEESQKAYLKVIDELLPSN